MAFQILIADDHPQLRELLRGVLEEQPGWHVCAAAGSGSEAVRRAIELKPDAIVLDYAMPGLDGVKAAREILLSLPGVPIILYTNHASGALEADAKKAGIRQVVSKVGSANELIETVRTFASEKVRLAAENIQAAQAAKQGGQTGAT